MNTENKANNCQNLPLQYVEQIALNKSGIACLDGRVDRVEVDIRERYTKSEVDCMLAGKADRCVLEKHLIDPCAHRSGCRPGGCRNPNVCDCDYYTKEEIDALFAKKANIGPPEIYDITLYEGISPRNGAECWKNPFNEVTVAFKVYKEGGFSSGGHAIGELPEGFRPVNESVTACGFAQQGPHDIGDISVWIDHSGIINIHLREISDADHVAATLVFLGK